MKIYIMGGGAEKLSNLEVYEDIKKIDIGNGVLDKALYITVYLSEVLEKHTLTEESCEDFLRFFIAQKNIKSEIINGTEFKDGKVFIYTKGGGKYSFEFQEYREYSAKEVLEGEKLEDLENKIQTLHFVMDFLYEDNNGVFDELDYTDVVNIPKLLKARKPRALANLDEQAFKKLLQPYKGMHLGELKEQLDLEQQRLVLYYDIIGETKKSVAFLEKQLDYYAAVGDKYDLGERVLFSEGVKKETPQEQNETPKQVEKKKLIDLVVACIKFDNRGVFSKVTEEDVVSIGRILQLRNKQQRDDEIRAALIKRNGSANVGPRIKEFDVLTELSDGELSQLLQEFKGMNVSELTGTPKTGIVSTAIEEITIPKVEKQELTTQIMNVSEQIIKKKSVPELIDYIRRINNKIAKNGSLPDMSKELNKVFVENLTEKTFEKMKREEASTREFINFARVITGRELTDKNGNERKYRNYVPGKYKANHMAMELQLYPENEVQITSELEQTDLARKVLLYVLYKGGAVNQISQSVDENGNRQDVVVEDSVYTEKKKEQRIHPKSGIAYEIEVDGEKINSIGTILERSFSVFEKMGLDRDTLIQDMGLENIMCTKDIASLSFNEKLLLGTLYRISKGIEKDFERLQGMTPTEVKTYLSQANNQALEQTFSELNNSFEKNFDASFWNGNWNGKNAHEFDKLSKENGEVFDLYGEINGRGYFELADDNWIARNLLTKDMAVVLAVGVLTAHLTLPGVIMATGGRALLMAGAKIGATTSIASQIMSNKGYDTVGEAAAGRITQFGIDVVSSAVFTWGSGKVLGKILGNKFQNTLTKEMKDISEGRATSLTEKTISRIKEVEGEIGKELGQNFGFIGKISRSPDKFWKTGSTAVYEELIALQKTNFTGKLSSNAIQYIARFSATTRGKGQLADMGIGLGDGINASILQQIIELEVLNKFFLENHFDPNQGETIENVYQKHEEREKQKKLLEKQEAQLEERVKTINLEGEEVRKILKESKQGNTQPGIAWNELSETEQREVIGAILRLKYIHQMQQKSLENLTKEEKSALSTYVGMIFKRNNSEIQ